MSDPAAAELPSPILQGRLANRVNLFVSASLYLSYFAHVVRCPFSPLLYSSLSVSFLCRFTALCVSVSRSLCHSIVNLFVSSCVIVTTFSFLFCFFSPNVSLCLFPCYLFFYFISLPVPSCFPLTKRESIWYFTKLSNHLLLFPVLACHLVVTNKITQDVLYFACELTFMLK